MNLRKQYVNVADANALARGPTGSSMNLKKTIAAIAAASMRMSSFTVATNGGLMDTEEKMIWKPQSADTTVKNMLAAGDRDGGWSKRITAEETPAACLRRISSAMHRATRHMDTSGPVALAILVSA